MVDAKLTETVEEYLEAIYNMVQEGRPVIGARLAERLRVTPPTVTGMIRRLTRDGLVASNERREILLTEKGYQTAETMVRRHRLAERLLTDILGVDWHKAHEEACQFEHAISPEVESRLVQVLGGPTTCPHGNPIPGTGYVGGESFSLSEVADGESVEVDRVLAEAERERGLLEYLQSQGMVPGARLLVQKRSTWGGTVTLAVGERVVVLGLPTAAKIQVRAIHVS